MTILLVTLISWRLDSEKRNCRATGSPRLSLGNTGCRQEFRMGSLRWKNSPNVYGRTYMNSKIEASSLSSTDSYLSLSPINMAIPWSCKMMTAPSLNSGRHTAITQPHGITISKTFNKLSPLLLKCLFLASCLV